MSGLQEQAIKEARLELDQLIAAAEIVREISDNPNRPMIPKNEVGAVRRLLRAFEVTIGEIREIRLHPSGSRFDGPAVVVNATTIRVMGLSDGHGNRLASPPLGAFVDLVSLTDPTRRVVRTLIAATLPTAA